MNEFDEFVLNYYWNYKTMKNYIYIITIETIKTDKSVKTLYYAYIYIYIILCIKSFLYFIFIYIIWFYINIY